MLKLDRNGYIAHLLANYGADEAKYSRDLCGVIRGLMLSSVMIIALITAATGGIFLLFAWIVPLLAYGFNYAVWYEPFFSLTFIIFSISCVAMTASMVQSKYNRWREGKRIKNGYYDEYFGPDDPSIFEVWYDGFKNKYCPRVEFVDKDEDA